ANLGLRERADREENLVEDVSIDAGENGRLIFLPLVAAGGGGSVFADVFERGVMSGGDAVGSDRLGERPELAELQPVVAHHARIRRAAGEILLGEVILD